MSRQKPAMRRKATKSAPEWLTDHFQTSLDAHDKLMQITRLSQQGIQMHLAVPNVVRVLAKIKAEDDEGKTKLRFERAEQDAALARKEIDEGFPVLHGFVTIALWSWMEDFVKGLVALWLLRWPSSMSVNEVQKLKVNIGDYVKLSKSEQALFLVDLLEQDISSPLKNGIGRFTSLLDVISINVNVSDDTKKKLFELQKVRNNLAHRNGRADRRLMLECPWLNLKINERVCVSFGMLKAYADASGEFLLQLLYSCGDMYGIDARPAVN